MYAKIIIVLRGLLQFKGLQREFRVGDRADLRCIIRDIAELSRVSLARCWARGIYTPPYANINCRNNST